MDPEFNIESYKYDLPTDHIAQVPAAKRDSSRLLVLDTRNGTVQDKHFTDILDYFQAGDLLVVNDTKVFPARFEGRKETGGKAELFLLEYPDFRQMTRNTTAAGPENTQCHYTIIVEGLLKSSKRPRIGTRLIFSQAVSGELLRLLDSGRTVVKLDITTGPVDNPGEILMQCGRVPLPPYIRRGREDHPDDFERYQTIFASKSGAVAAPTAGFHFSDELLARLRDKNIRIAPITLHVGYGTFAPVRTKDIRQHKIHEEYVAISHETAGMINETIEAGGNVRAVGTTTVRALEFAATANGRVAAVEGWCGLYIYPGYEFKVVNSLITNFHLPGSSLLFLVSALAGRPTILRAYEKAIASNYRFYSYGDAMLIIT